MAGFAFKVNIPAKNNAYVSVLFYNCIVNLFSVNSNIITVLDFVLLLRKLQNMRN